MKKRRVFAWIAIILLGSMYLACLVLALIGSEAAKLWLKIALVCTMVVPLVLYGFLVLTRANMRSGRPAGAPEEEPEEPSGEGLIAREAARVIADPDGIRESAFEAPEEPFRTEEGVFAGTEEIALPPEPGMSQDEIFDAEAAADPDGDAGAGEGEADGV